MLYGVVPWPAFPVLPTSTRTAARRPQGVRRSPTRQLAWLAYATIALHVAAALKHQFIDRDDVLARMIPFLRRRTGAAS